MTMIDRIAHVFCSVVLVAFTSGAITLTLPRELPEETRLIIVLAAFLNAVLGGLFTILYVVRYSMGKP